MNALETLLLLLCLAVELGLPEMQQDLLEVPYRCRNRRCNYAFTEECLVEFGLLAVGVMFVGSTTDRSLLSGCFEQLSFPEFD